MIWQPLSLSETCPMNSSLTACSAFGHIYLNLLVQLFGGSLDERIQKKYKYNEPDNNNTEYDFIVVGAGAAGCVVARRLTDNHDWKVLLLEAGPEQPDVTIVPALSTALLGSNIDWGYTTEPNGRSCLAREGRCSWAFPTMIWQPLNLTEVCPPNSTLTACSHFGYVYLNLLVHLFNSSIDEKIKKFYNKPDENQDEFDFIVVGAGAAGCVVANRLSANPDWKVLLLEAGTEQPDVTLVPGLSGMLRSTNIVEEFKTEPNGKSCLAQPGGRCSWPVGKTMGGSSSTNNLAYLRGNKADYDGWAMLGNEGWSYKDVLPFFKKSERNTDIEFLDRKYHGVSGEQYISWYSYTDKPSLMMTEAFMERGLPLTDVNGAQQEGVMQAQAFAFLGQRVSTNTAFIQPIRYKKENLIVKVNSEVIKILIDENKRAYGVIYTRNGKKFTAYSKKEVIVSAGALNSPKLLMLSGIGPKEHLEQLGIPVIKDLAVGENLQDHVTFYGLYIALSNETSTIVSQEKILEDIIKYDKMDNKTGPLAINGPSSTIAFFKSNPDLIAPDLQCHCRHIFKWREFYEDPLTAEEASIFPTSYYDSILARIINVSPKSRGKLLLNATNPHGPPILYGNYFDDESDIIALLKGVRLLLSLEETDAFKLSGTRFVREPMPACKEYEWGTDEYFICIIRSYTMTIYHYVGTCKMGPKTDKKAVLDNELRVYGICGLRIIDASMMPFVVRGNTNAPSIMIGERGVDFVINYWQKNSEPYCA